MPTTTASDGVEIAYDVTGAGPPLVLVHGITESREVWDPLIADLATDHRVVALDVRGHGESGAAATYGTEAMAGDVSAVVVALGLDLPVVVGHSMGGIVVTTYAGQHPCRGVVNVDQSIALGDFQELVRGAEPALRSDGFADVITALFDSMHGPLPDAEVARVRALRRPVQEVVLGVWAPLLELSPAELDELVVAVTSSVRVPYLALHGIDPGPDYGHWLEAAIATATLEVWEASGHYPHLVHQQRFVDRLRVFESDLGVIALGLLPPYRLNVASDPAWMAAFAQHADEVGFESLLAVEHVAVPVGYESRYPYSDTGRMPLPQDCEIPDPLDLLAWLAARTERIRLGTGILVLPEHHPVQLAKRCATIDRLSGGRLFLGVGVGWMREEVAALGIDPDEQGTRTDEGIEALRILWREATPSFAGRHYAFDALRSQPKPAQPTIPILVGGHSGAAARRAGRLGDGFFPLGLSGDALDRRWAQVQAAAADAGRDPCFVSLTLGGLLGDDAAIHRAVDRGAARVVLSTRTDDLDELRHAMDAAVELAARR